MAIDEARVNVAARRLYGLVRDDVMAGVVEADEACLAVYKLLVVLLGAASQEGDTTVLDAVVTHLPVEVRNAAKTLSGPIGVVH